MILDLGYLHIRRRDLLVPVLFTSGSFIGRSSQHLVVWRHGETTEAARVVVNTPSLLVTITLTCHDAAVCTNDATQHNISYPMLYRTHDPVTSTLPLLL